MTDGVDMFITLVLRINPENEDLMDITVSADGNPETEETLNYAFDSHTGELIRHAVDHIVNDVARKNMDRMGITEEQYQAIIVPIHQN